MGNEQISNDVVGTEKKDIKYKGRRNRTISYKNNKYNDNPQRLNGVDDLAKLIHFDIENISKNIEYRYCNASRKLYYTSIKHLNVLLSINPYKKLSIYNQDIMNELNIKSNKGILSDILHPYAVAANVLRKMNTTKMNQSIIIRGESGSGKTESWKLVISYLTKITSPPTTYDHDDEKMNERIVAISSVLEAFGNAKTMRNNNSSRFGKLITLFYSTKQNKEKNTDILGAHLITYSLERSRLIQQSMNESNFHIFYMLLNVFGSNNNEFGLKSIDKFNYLTHRECVETIINDKEKFEMLQESLTTLKITDDQQVFIWKIVSGILNLGNIVFKRDGDGYFASIHRNSMEYIILISSLWGITTKALEERLTTKTMKIMRRTIVKKLVFDDDALININSMTKNIYQLLFSWINEKANASFTINSTDNDNIHFIAILDSMGYQNFYINSLEHFNINYTNEKLQQYFNKYITNNDEVICWKTEYTELDDRYFELMGKKEAYKDHFYHLLDSACKAPKPAVETFVVGLFHKNGKNPILSLVREYGSSDRNLAIMIHHFNDDVTYNLQQLLIQNMEAIHNDTAKMMKKSANMIFKEIPCAQYRKHRRRRSTSGILRKCFQDLLDTLNSTEPYFICCLNPNHDKSSSMWNTDIIQQQLSGYGIGEALKKLKYKNLFISACVRKINGKLYIPQDVVRLIYQFCRDIVIKPNDKRGDDSSDSESSDYSASSEVNQLLDEILNELCENATDEMKDELESVFDLYQNNVNEAQLIEIDDIRNRSDEYMTSIISNAEHLRMVRLRIAI